MRKLMMIALLFLVSCDDFKKREVAPRDYSSPSAYSGLDRKNAKCLEKGGIPFTDRDFFGSHIYVSCDVLDRSVNFLQEMADRNMHSYPANDKFLIELCERYEGIADTESGILGGDFFMRCNR